MSLMINQGTHNPNNTGLYEPIEDKDIPSVIESIELNKNLPGNFDIKLRLLTGEHKGFTVRDTVPYEASAKSAWRYVNIRAAAGEPYSKNEPATIDIEEKLKDKVVIGTYSIYTKSDGTKRQNCTYRQPTKEELASIFGPVNEEDYEEVMEDTSVTQTPLSIKEEPQVVSEATDDDEWE